jgi:hypothetical protein
MRRALSMLLVVFATHTLFCPGSVSSIGELDVTYSMHSEPGGSLPSWGAAGMVAHLPYETMKKLKTELER